MPQIILDTATVQLLLQAKSRLDLVDAKGNLIGHFEPAGLPCGEPKISEEEIQRRKKEERGRPLADILADLEKRA